MKWLLTLRREASCSNYTRQDVAFANVSWSLATRNQWATNGGLPSAFDWNITEGLRSELHSLRICRWLYSPKACLVRTAASERACFSATPTRWDKERLDAYQQKMPQAGDATDRSNEVLNYFIVDLLVTPETCRLSCQSALDSCAFTSSIDSRQVLCSLKIAVRRALLSSLMSLRLFVASLETYYTVSHRKPQQSRTHQDEVAIAA